LKTKHIVTVLCIVFSQFVLMLALIHVCSDWLGISVCTQTTAGVDLAGEPWRGKVQPVCSNGEDCWFHFELHFQRS